MFVQASAAAVSHGQIGIGPVPPCDLPAMGVARKHQRYMARGRVVECLWIVREHQIDTLITDGGLDSLSAAGRRPGPADTSDAETIIPPCDLRHIIVQHCGTCIRDDAFDVFTRVEFIVVPQHEEVSERRPDGRERLSNWLDTRPVQIDEVAGVADHVW